MMDQKWRDRIRAIHIQGTDSYCRNCGNLWPCVVVILLNDLEEIINQK